MLWLQIAGLPALSSKALECCPTSQMQMHGCCCHSRLTHLAGPTPSATYLVHTPQGFGKQHISRRHVREHIGVCILIRIQALLSELVLAGSLPFVISPAQWPRYNLCEHKDCRAIWSGVLHTARVCSASCAIESTINDLCA